MKLFRGMPFLSVMWTVVLLLSVNLVHRSVAATIPGCVGAGPIDVVFLIDSSFSVWRHDFRRQLTFVQEVIEMLPIGPSNTRVAIVTYADHPQLQFHLHEYSTKRDLRAAVEDIRQRGGFQTITGDAIRFLRRSVFEVGLRSRPLGVNAVTRVAVVVTDGQSDNRTVTVIEAELAKQEGVRMLLVGVGKDVDLEELKDIGSQPSDYYTFHIDSFAGLAGIRDLVATRTCRASESVKMTKVFSTSTTAATTLANARPASTETSTKKASVKTTMLRELISTARVNSISTSATATFTFIPNSVPHPKPTFTRPDFERSGFSRTISTAAVSTAVTTSPVSPVSTWKLFSETALPTPDYMSLPPSAGVTRAGGPWKVENSQSPTKESPMAISIRDGGVQTVNNETTVKKQSSVFPTRVSEVIHRLIATRSDLRSSKDSTNNPHTITSTQESSCESCLLDKILNAKSSSEAPKTDGEAAKEENGKDSEQQRTTTGGNNEIERVAEDQRSTASTPLTLTQVTDGAKDAGMKTILEATATKSTRKADVADGRTTTKSTLVDGPQAVITSGYENLVSVEPRVLANNSDQDGSDRDSKREINGRSEYQSGFEGKDHWRLSNTGTLIRYRMIGPDVYEREEKASHRTPRLQSNPRRIVISRSRATFPGGPVIENPFHRLRNRSHLNQGSIGEESRDNRSSAAHSGDHPTNRYNRRIAARGRRLGYPLGSADTRVGAGGTVRYRHKEASEMRRIHREQRPYTHNPSAVTSSGYWRLNDLGKLVWMNYPKGSPRPSQGHATGRPHHTRFPYVHQTRNASINPGSSHTHSHLEIDGADHLASNSAAHPRLTTDNDIDQRKLFLTEVTDATESVSKQTTGSTLFPKHSGAENKNHNPKQGFWMYDRFGRNSFWVNYTRSPDAMKAEHTTVAQDATTHPSNGHPTSGTKGPSLVNSDGLSYGYWKKEKGKPVWYEYQSPGIYRKVFDTDILAVTNKIRIELPRGMALGCAGCNRTGSPIWDGVVKVNQSSSSEEMVVLRATDRVEKLMLNRTGPIRVDEKRNRDLWRAFTNLKETYSEELDSNSSRHNSRLEESSTLMERTENKMSLVHRYNRTISSSSDGISLQSPSPLDPGVRGMNATGNAKSNWTSESTNRTRNRGYNEMDRGRGRSQRKNITTGGVQQGFEDKQRTRSSASTTVRPRRDGATRSAFNTANSVSSSPPTRKQLKTRKPDRVVVGTNSVHRNGSSVRKNPSASKNRKKHVKGCVARSPLDVVFVVDPRAQTSPYSKHLWQLAYEVVSQVRMDDDRIRVRFYPELEVVKAANASKGSSEYYGSVQTVIQKVAQKPVPDLLRAASLLMSRSDDGGLRRRRRIGIYLTDGPSGATQEQLAGAAEEVKGDGGVEMFAVGVGQETDPAELETIATTDISRLKGKHWFRVPEQPDDRDIDQVASKLTRALCGER